MLQETFRSDLLVTIDPQRPPQKEQQPKHLSAPAQSKETRLPEGLRPWRATRGTPIFRAALVQTSLRPPSHFVPGGEPHLLHLPPLLAWARAKACLLANTARPFKNGGTTHEQHRHHERNQQRYFPSHRTQATDQQRSHRRQREAPHRAA